jgi:hypothetical protein
VFKVYICLFSFVLHVKKSDLIIVSCDHTSLIQLGRAHSHTSITFSRNIFFLSNLCIFGAFLGSFFSATNKLRTFQTSNNVFVVNMVVRFMLLLGLNWDMLSVHIKGGSVKSMYGTYCMYSLRN